ncbi:MAG: hypothetical protein NVS3B12_07000 [Acidimicrobiales bacterium]
MWTRRAAPPAGQDLSRMALVVVEPFHTALFHLLARGGKATNLPANEHTQATSYTAPTSRTHDKIEAFSCGVDHYVITPFSPRDLTSRVRAGMRQRPESTPAHLPDKRHSIEPLG